METLASVNMKKQNHQCCFDADIGHVIKVMIVKDDVIFHLFFTGRCGPRQPGTSPGPLSDHCLRLVPLWVRIGVWLHKWVCPLRSADVALIHF